MIKRVTDNRDPLLEQYTILTLSRTFTLDRTLILDRTLTLDRILTLSRIMCYILVHVFTFVVTYYDDFNIE